MEKVEKGGKEETRDIGRAGKRNWNRKGKTKKSWREGVERGGDGGREQEDVYMAGCGKCKEDSG